MHLHRLIFYSPEAPAPSAPAPAPAPSAPAAPVSAPAPSPPPSDGATSVGMEPSKAGGEAPSDKPAAPPEPPPFDWNTWDGKDEAAPENFRPALSRARGLWKAEQDKLIAQKDAENIRRQAEYEAQIKAHNGRIAEYEKRLAGDGRTDRSEYDKVAQERDHWRKIAGGMEDPRIAEFVQKESDYKAKLTEAEKRLAEYAEKEEQASARKILDANPHLKNKATWDEFMVMLADGWDDEAAAILVKLPPEGRKAATEYANKYKLGEGQHLIAAEWAAGKFKPSSGEPSKGAMALDEGDGGGAGDSGSHLVSLPMEEARLYAARTALRVR